MFLLVKGFWSYQLVRLLKPQTWSEWWYLNVLCNSTNNTVVKEVLNPWASEHYIEFWMSVQRLLGSLYKDLTTFPPKEPRHLITWTNWSINWLTVAKRKSGREKWSKSCAHRSNTLRVNTRYFISSLYFSMRFDRRNSRKWDKHYTQQVMRITQFLNKIFCWIFFNTFYFKTSVRNKHLMERGFYSRYA